MSKFKDVAHLYLGVEVVTRTNEYNTRGYLTGIFNGGGECEIQFFLDDDFNVAEDPEFEIIDDVKPILHPLSAMTTTQRLIYGILDDSKLNANQFLKLLNDGFDLFGLIESGEAIDKSKLPK